MCSLEGRAADPVRVALAISRLSTLAWRRLVAWPACENSLTASVRPVQRGSCPATPRPSRRRRRPVGRTRRRTLRRRAADRRARAGGDAPVRADPDAAGRLRVAVARDRTGGHTRAGRGAARVARSHRMRLRRSRAPRRRPRAATGRDAGPRQGPTHRDRLAPRHDRAVARRHRGARRRTSTRAAVHRRGRPRRQPRRNSIALMSGGPDMAPQIPQRSERHGSAGALLDVALTRGTGRRCPRSARVSCRGGSRSRIPRWPAARDRGTAGRSRARSAAGAASRPPSASPAPRHRRAA